MEANNTTDALTDIIETCEITADIIVLLVVTITILIVGLAANVIAIATIVVSKKIRLKDQGMIIGVSASDTLFLGLCFPFIIVVISRCGQWPMGQGLCLAQGYLTLVTFHSATYNIMLIAVMRYISIVHIATFRRISSGRRIMAYMAVAWLVSALIPAPALLGWGTIHFDPLMDSCLYDWTHSSTFTTYIAVASIWLPLAVVVYCYIGIFVKFHRSNRKTHVTPQATSQTDPSGRDHVTKRVAKDDRRLAIQLLLLVAAFVVSWLPYCVLAWYIDPQRELSKDVYDVTSNFMIVHTILDPLVYFFGNRSFRMEAWNMLRCMR